MIPHLNHRRSLQPSACYFFRKQLRQIGGGQHSTKARTHKIMARTQLIRRPVCAGKPKWRAHLPHFQKAWLNPHEVHVISQHARGWKQFDWARFERNPWPRFRKSKSFEKTSGFWVGVFKNFQKTSTCSTWSRGFLGWFLWSHSNNNSETFKPKACETWVLYYRLKVQNSAKTGSIFSRIPEFSLGVGSQKR